LTRDTKRASVRDISRRHADSVQHADQTQGNAMRSPSSPEPIGSLPDKSVMPVMQRTMPYQLTHGLSETMIERLLKRNDVALLIECDQGVCSVPYRGKQRLSDILRFLRMAGPKARALVYSHQTEEGPVWINVVPGDVSSL
jgi:hypothetical protein